MISDSLRKLRDALTTCEEREPLVSVVVPLILPSTANLREHWATKAGRAKTQRAAVLLVLKPQLKRHRAPRGAVVRLVRIAPRRLDDDNAARSLKSVRDAVAEALGVDDGDASVTWIADQDKGPASVLVEVYRG